MTFLLHLVHKEGFFYNVLFMSFFLLGDQGQFSLFLASN